MTRRLAFLVSTAVALFAFLCPTAMPRAFADYPDDCLGVFEPSAPDCSAIDGLEYAGCCDSDGRLVWCDVDGLYCIDCAGLNPECGWSVDAGFYDCGTDGSEEPSGTAPKDCAGCDPKCGPGFKCVQGQCEVCTPQCEGKQCGKDGCGGTCGTCDGSLICTPAGQCVEVPLCKMAGAFHCDEAHSGTTVGVPNTLQDYPCWFDYLNGGEVGFSFYAAVDDTVQVDFQAGDGAADLYLLVLSGSCAEAACVDWLWPGLSTVSVVAGTTYYFVVDGYAGGEGSFKLSLKCESTCVPNCEGKQCGDDGCFGTCGECLDGICSNNLCMTGPGCVYSDIPGCEGCPCEACVCGMDPYCCDTAWDSICVGECVDSCGGCANLENCGDGTCQAADFENCGNCPSDCVCGNGTSCFQGTCCQPSCEGKECGDDGCGGSCADCPADLACIGNTCQANDGCYATSTPGCPNCICEACVCELYPPCCEEAWDEVCAMYCDGWCEGCGALVACGDGQCQPDLLETCSNCPGDCACGEGEICFEQYCCTPYCEGLECGDDGCGGACGMCPEGKVCSWDGFCVEGGGGCFESEVPGCGGCLCESCVCEMDSYCCDIAWDSLCVSECMDYCGGCGGGPGMCGDGTCENDPTENCGTCPQDCACAQDEVCMWDTCCAPDCDGKECGDDGCGGSCGNCAPGCSCQDGTCPADCGCEPACSLKECGDDGCGGSCGDCEKGSACNADGQCEPICVPDCEDRECGNDGCDGSCGDCAPGVDCLPDGTCQGTTPEPTAEPAPVEQVPDAAGLDSPDLTTGDGVAPADSVAPVDTVDDGKGAAKGGCSAGAMAWPTSSSAAILLALLLLSLRQALRRLSTLRERTTMEHP